LQSANIMRLSSADARHFSGWADHRMGPAPEAGTLKRSAVSPRQSQMTRGLPFLSGWPLPLPIRRHFVKNRANLMGPPTMQAVVVEVVGFATSNGRSATGRRNDGAGVCFTCAAPAVCEVQPTEQCLQHQALSSSDHIDSLVAVQSTVACAAAVVEVCATEDACGSFAGVVTSGVDAGNSDVLLLLLLLLLVLRVLLSQGDPEHPSASCLQHHSSFVSPHVFGLPSLQSWGLRFTLWPPSQPVPWCLQQKTFCCAGQDALAPVHLNGSVTNVVAFVVAGADVIASVVMGACFPAS